MPREEETFLHRSAQQAEMQCDTSCVWPKESNVVLSSVLVLLSLCLEPRTWKKVANGLTQTSQHV